MASVGREERAARQRLQDYQAKQTVHSEQIGRRRRDNVIAAIVVVVVLAVATTAQVLYFEVGPGVPAPTPTASPTPTPTETAGNTGDVPSADIAEDRTWTGTMQLNDVSLGISLDGALAPQGVSSFIALAQQDFYTGKSCHRLTDGGFFVLQCGSVNGDGTGDPGFQFGPIENAPAEDFYPAGTIAFARQSGNAYSNSSQFFIVYEDTTIPSDEAGGYTIIGQVTSGLPELATAITDAGTADGGNDGSPAVATTIGAITLQ
ncbi:peptidylprolyl isomerase [Herbiconiux sp. L3-i23]|uniref:peptidylprolyl isomerase n=1 Tax=Herbiconiux sp. L3-i23 TaxID=2905871 RepID=UPI00206F673E|nr:peptidylprolyl isomerase [Herbiconiux sp. L3-i23]BDI22803.1 hypothetical protein L3i23_15790 [Herbiconiux sp. L3-i23]